MKCAVGLINVLSELLLFSVIFYYVSHPDAAEEIFNDIDNFGNYSVQNPVIQLDKSSFLSFFYYCSIFYV